MANKEEFKDIFNHLIDEIQSEGVTKSYFFYSKSLNQKFKR